VGSGFGSTFDGAGEVGKRRISYIEFLVKVMSRGNRDPALAGFMGV